MRERLRKAVQLAIHPFSEILLAELKQENAHRSERRVIKSESSSYSVAAVVPFALCRDAVTCEYLLFSEACVT